MSNYKKFFDANKANWNKRVNPHYESNFYNVKDFIHTKNSLNSIESEELGDIKGKEILHLQCHFGQDTLSFANNGAIATGADFSTEAISKANELKGRVNLDAKFICSNIYELKENLKDKFDIVFTSYGTIGWLPDINRWAEIVSHFLKPDGKFFIADFHPFIWMYDDNFEYFKFPYFHSNEPIEEVAEGTYTDGDSEINMIQYSWNHTISDIINSLIGNGLIIESFKEYDYSPYNCFPKMIEIENGKFIFEHLQNKIPIVYSIMARKIT